MQTLKALFTDRRFYLAWCIGSAGVLLAASYVHPHIFGFSTFCAAAVSGLIVLGAATLNWRYLPWALVAASPTIFAFWRLSTYKWA